MVVTRRQILALCAFLTAGNVIMWLFTTKSSRFINPTVSTDSIKVEVFHGNSYIHSTANSYNGLISQNSTKITKPSLTSLKFERFSRVDGDTGTCVCPTSSGSNEPILKDPSEKTEQPYRFVSPKFERFSRLDGDPDNKTYIEDIIIAIKSTKINHKKRLDLLLDTWILQAFNSTFLITDDDDNETAKRLAEGNYLNTKCGASHARQHLVCKLRKTLELFHGIKRRWYCIADDDTYILIPNLVKLLQRYDHQKEWYVGKPSLPFRYAVLVNGTKRVLFRFATGGACLCLSQALLTILKNYTQDGELERQGELIKNPDDVLLGYLAYINSISLTIVEELHSHIEGMWLLEPKSFHKQISLSYGEVSSYKGVNIPNTVVIREEFPVFPAKVDPTRLLSVHCYLFSDAPVCKKLKYSEMTRNSTDHS